MAIARISDHTFLTEENSQLSNLRSSLLEISYLLSGDNVSGIQKYQTMALTLDTLKNVISKLDNPKDQDSGEIFEIRYFDIHDAEGMKKKGWFDLSKENVISKDDCPDMYDHIFNDYTQNPGEFSSTHFDGVYVKVVDDGHCVCNDATENREAIDKLHESGENVWLYILNQSNKSITLPRIYGDAATATGGVPCVAYMKCR